MSFIAKLSKNHLRLIVMGLMVILALIAFAKTVDDVFYEPGEGDTDALVFDKTVLTTFNSWRSPSVSQSMIDITALGSFSVITLMTSLLVIFLVTKKDWSGLLYIFFIMLGSAIIPAVFKNYFMRDRPDVMAQLEAVKSHSFPSGHSFSATVAYLAFAFLLSREVKNIRLEILYYILAGIVVLLVGTSRMYLGVHYPTDIFAGICLGLTWFLLVSIPFTVKKLDTIK